MDEIDLLDYFTASGLSPMERAFAESGMRDGKAAADEGADEAARKAASAQHQEALEFANRQQGDPLGQLQRARAAYSNADDEVRQLSVDLAKAERKRATEQGNIKFWAERAQLVTGMVERSAPSGGVEGAVSRAQEAARELSLQRVERRLASRSASRSGPPFGDGAAAPDLCDRAKYDAEGFCGCAACFEFEEQQAKAETQAERLMALGYSAPTAGYAAGMAVR